MSDHRYSAPPEATAQHVREALALGHTGPEVAELLVGATLHDPNRNDIEDLCIELLGGPERGLAAAAATGLGHLARIHRDLDLNRAIPALLQARSDPIVGPHAHDALSDIEVFLNVKLD